MARQGIRFSVAPGSAGATALPGEPGSLYLPDTHFMSSSMENMLDVRIFGLTAWSGPFLVLEGRKVRFAEESFALTIAGDVVCGGGGALHLPPRSELHGGGDLWVTNGGQLVVQAGITNGSSPSYGSLVSVTGTLFVGSGSWIYPLSDRTNNAGAATLFRAESLTVEPNAGFNANTRGYAGGIGQYDSGYGPGGGLVSSYYGGGGAHGGAGGNGSNGAGGAPYDRTNAPVKAGSGGGGELSGSGGGAIWVEASGRMTVDGTLTANASSGLTYGGGGAGGSIRLACERFAGGPGAVLSATGGNAGQQTAASGGGGGGGRIAVWYGVFTDADRAILESDGLPSRAASASSFSGFLGSVSATNGINATYPARNGGPGTVAFIFVPRPPGTVWFMR